MFCFWVGPDMSVMCKDVAKWSDTFVGLIKVKSNKERKMCFHFWNVHMPFYFILISVANTNWMGSIMISLWKCFIKNNELVTAKSIGPPDHLIWKHVIFFCVDTWNHPWSIEQLKDVIHLGIDTIPHEMAQLSYGQLSWIPSTMCAK